MRDGNLELEKNNNIYMKHVLQLNTLTYWLTSCGN